MALPKDMGTIYENSKGERLVFIHEGFDRYEGRKFVELWDLATGKGRQINPSALDKMKNLGPDMELRNLPTADELEPFSPTTNLDFFYPYLDYLIDILAGKEGVKSFYVWLDEIKEEIPKNLRRVDYLKLRSFELRFFLLEILRHFGEKASPRYQWLIGPER